MNNESYIILLKSLIRAPSYSGEEEQTASILLEFMRDRNWNVERIHNNLMVTNLHYDLGKDTVILNSHHDTVKPNESYSYDPFSATEENGRVIGLGSNDAGASLVSLIAAFEYFNKKMLNKNLILIASAEEENSGSLGIKSVLPNIKTEIDLAIVGEPTNCKAAIAEKGLLVIDAIVYGQAGHAARPNSQNAIDFAVADIGRINDYSFDRKSEQLGDVVKSVTQINAGSQHNVIPDRCSYVIDCRVNEHYELFEVLDQLQSICKAKLTARSFNNNPSFLPVDHPFMDVIKRLNINIMGSPTLSDQVHFVNPSVKIGPGFSERSHQADEFIYIDEIQKGIDTYINLLSKYLL